MANDGMNAGGGVAGNAPGGVGGMEFSYRAQTRFGQTISGTIVAESMDGARGQLVAMGLQVLDMGMVKAGAKVSRALTRDDFLLFNQQLAHLASAGLPVEQGLRLIAADVRSGRLSAAANDVAASLERGVAVEEAFAEHAGRFPPLYAQVVAAGVKAGNLPGLLLNMGQHLELVSRLRQSLWRTLAYPVAVFLMLIFVAGVVVTRILPQFREIFRDFRTNLPWLTECLLWAGDHAIYLAVGMLVVMLVVASLWIGRSISEPVRSFVERLTQGIPVVGGVLKRSLLARWCDALRLGVDAGLDLPQAIAIAGNTIDSPRLRREGEELGRWIEGGRALGEYPRGKMIPATVPAAMELGGKSGELSRTLGTLTRLFQAQAEHRLRVLPVVILPLFTVVLALMMGVVVVGSFLPLVKLIQSVSGD